MSVTMSAISVVVAATGSLPSFAFRFESQEQSANPTPKVTLAGRSHCFILLIELDWTNFSRKDYFSFPCLRKRASPFIVVSVPMPARRSTKTAPAVTQTRAVEDYLEQIHNLIEAKGYARVVDIA